MSLEQLTLNLYARDDMTFANFYAGANQKTVNFLQQLDNLAHKFIYLWGQTGVGCTHLLLACCQKFNAQNFRAIYVSLNDEAITAEFFSDLDDFTLLCIDDLDAKIGKREWEEEILHCFDERLKREVVTIITAHATPMALNFALPDLRSRMNSGLLFHVKSLDDAEKLQALRLQANFLGLDLPWITARFLLRHCERDLKALFDLLHHLDRASLATQRRLTIPFVKEILNFELRI